MLVKAMDHDFGDQIEKVHLFGVYLPNDGETFLFFFPDSAHLTADAIVDCLDLLCDALGERLSQIDRLLVNLDNGPENHSGRRQFMKRIVDLADTRKLIVELAYYPPYHSKYNPIERVWGVLEQHWNGTLLVDLETILAMASSMTYKGIKPVINVIKRCYDKGVTLCKAAMEQLETRLERHEILKRFAVTITPCG